MKDVVVIGSGPAGIAAAIYTARANLSTVIVAGPKPGGQVSLTWEIDNYPGFPERPTGAELSDRFIRHAQKLGAELLYDEALGVDFAGPILGVTTTDGEIQARAVVVAVGASARNLGVPGEIELLGRGVSYCATCDGAFFKGRKVYVVGGGDSAVEEALFLTRFASSVSLVHRRDQLRAGPGLQLRLHANDAVSVEWSSVVGEIQGTDRVQSVLLRQVDTGEERVEQADGVFIFIGHVPNSTLFRGVLDMDERGYIKVDGRMRASAPGVYAAGEIMDPVWRQVATSVGQGSAAGMSVVHDLG